MKKDFKLTRRFKISLPTFELKNGILLLSGPNGCGKTTMIRLLSSKFKEKPTSLLESKDEAFLSKSALFFEESLIAHSETLKKNLNYVSAVVSMDSVFQQELIEKLNLSKVINQKFSKCSTGEKKKFLAVLNLSQSDKSVYFLDEPFENIDKESKANLAAVLTSFFSETKTLILSSHQAQILEKIPHRELNFEEG